LYKKPMSKTDNPVDETKVARKTLRTFLS